jgi:hypothetical protein
MIYKISAAELSAEQIAKTLRSKVAPPYSININEEMWTDWLHLFALLVWQKEAIQGLEKLPLANRPLSPGASRGRDGRTLYYDFLTLIFPHERLFKR